MVAEGLSRCVDVGRQEVSEVSSRLSSSCLLSFQPPHCSETLADPLMSQDLVTNEMSTRSDAVCS
jgi:hypothetical protein